MTLKAAIIGCGNIAGGYDLNSSSRDILTHAKAYRENEGVQLVAACDTDPEKLSAFCKQWKVPGGFSDASEMMRAVRPDIVSICSPSECHNDNLFDIIDFPLRAIICEKPMALTFADAVRMEDRCRKDNIVLAVNYSRRWAPHFIAVSDSLKNVEFGEIQATRFLYTKGVFHNASHFINLASFWFGPLICVDVFSGGPWGRYDIAANFFARFERCQNVVFQNCNGSWYEVAEMDIVGKRKRVEILRGGGAIRKTDIVPHAILSGTGMFSPEIEQSEFIENRSLFYLVRDVIDAICKGSALVMGAEEALETVRICELVKEKANKLKEAPCQS